MISRLVGVTCIALLIVSSTICSVFAQDAKTEEDCIPYDPAKVRIVDKGESGWLLTDGHMYIHWLDNERDAKQALTLAKRHTMQCFIGRGNKRQNRSSYIVEYWE